MAERLAEAVAALKEATVWLGGALQGNQEAALAGATPYLRLFGLTAGAAYLARGALSAARGGDAPLAILQARFFAEHLLTAAQGLSTTVTSGGDVVLEATAEKLSG